MAVLALKTWVRSWRHAILGGAVLWGSVLVGITEVLSLVHGLTVAGLALAWLVALLTAMWVVALRGASPFAVSGRAAPRRSWLLLMRPLPRLEVAFFGALAGISIVLGGIAVVSPPNTWDSMTYHMARLIHWTEDASLAPYPTHILRQLYLQPGAEFILLHLQILSGSDHLAGLVQWASMVGALVAVPVIAQALGARRIGTVGAVMVAASLPIGILESTSTQNDYVVAFWNICAMAFAVRLTTSSALPWASFAAFGASVGLALLTKATAYLIVLPMVIWVTVSLMRRRSKRGLRLLVMAGSIALVLNTGFYARNVAVFGSPTGPLDEGAPTLRYINDAFAAPLIVSNIARDLGVNVNATPLAAINVRGLNFVRLLHGLLHVDIADPRTTWGEEIFAEQPAGLAFDENFASNPVHLLLVLAALGALWPLRRVLPRAVALYALTISAGFLLFAVLLRWQPWDTRLELPFFVLAAPLVGVVVERVSSRFAFLLSVALLISMLPWVAYNQARPLVGPRSILGSSRADQYFTNRPSMRSAYFGAIGFLAERGCARVGFVSTVDGWEYPLWPLLRGSVPGPFEIEHVDVTNVSARQTDTQLRAFEPCAVLVLGPTASDGSLEVAGQTWRPGFMQLDPTDPLQHVAVMTPDGR
jgi:hypothetical protein